MAILNRRAAVEFLVAVLFVALACAWWWPLPLHLINGQLEFPPIDTAFNQWIVGWGVHALTTDTSSYFDANMFHPHDDVLAWGDHLFALAIFAVPLVPLLGVVGASNALLIGGVAASGWTTYLLVRHVTRQRTVAVVAGAIFVFAWHRRIEWAHIQIQATQWIPAVFLAAEHALSRRTIDWRDRRSWAWASFLAVAAWFVAATNVYLAVFTVLAFGVYGAASLALGRFTVRSAVLTIGAWALALALALPLYLPSIRYQDRLDVERSLEEQTAISLDDLDPWPPPGRGYSEIRDRITGEQSFALDYYTPDLVTLALIVAGLSYAAARRRFTDLKLLLAYGAAALFAVASALGPQVRWRDSELFPNPVFLASYHLVPGYNALRLPARWSLVAALLLAVVAAVLVAPLLHRLARPARMGVGVALIAVAGVVLIPAPWGVTDSYDIEDFPAHRWLADAPRDGAILELPISADVASSITQRIEAKRMLLSTTHWRSRVSGGVSPVITPEYGDDALLLAELADAGGASRADQAIEWLRDNRVVYVVFSPAEYTEYGADPMAVRAALDVNDGLRLVRDFGDQVVYEVTLPGRSASPGGAG